MKPLARSSHNFLHVALISAELWTQNPIPILNAPAHFVNLPITYVMSRGPFWSPPNFLGPAGWCCLTYPFFALPAWCYVGFGIDALLGRKRIRTTNLIVSLILVMLLGTLAAVLRFGLIKIRAWSPG
ncbi:MAG TPA: hypothetical protein VIX37_11160 [Candidatus Sulfotelmatobacter sp.]